MIDFGTFVDIGLKHDGLVHISRMSQNYIKYPLDGVSVGDLIPVWLVDIDRTQMRVGLGY